MKPIKLDEFKNYKFLSGIETSDCGQYVAYVVARMDIEENNYKKALFVLDTKTNKTQQISAENIESFFGFNEDSLLFSARRTQKEKDATDKTFVYSLPLSGGEAQLAYTFDFPVLKIKFINKKTAVVLHNWKKDEFAKLSKDKAKDAREEEKDYKVIEEIPFWQNGAGFTSRKRNRLYLYNLTSMKSTELTDEFTSVGSFELNDEKTKLLFTKVTYTEVMPIYEDLMLMDIKTKKAKKINHTDEFSYAAAKFFDDKILFAGADGKKYGINQDADIYIMDETGKNAKMISPKDWDKSMWNSVGSDARFGGGKQTLVHDEHFYFITTEDDSSYINRINKDGEIEKVTTTKGAIDCYDFAKNKAGEDSIFFIGFRGQELQELYSLDLNGNETVLTNHNQFAKKMTKITPEEFEFTDNGVKLHGFVLKPLGYKESKKYPAILTVHGGPKTVYGSIFYHELQFFAQAGYFVFYTNPRGSDGNGREFADIRGKYGSVDYENLMKLTDEVLKRYKSIDKNKLGVMGGSYGGFMTNWIIGHTNRFAAACSQRSISNWISKFGITDIGYYFNSDQNGNATPWNGFDVLWDHSPLKYANNCKTPTLFIHGDSDYRCSQSCAFQMFTALKLHGCEARLVLFHGENHELSRSGKPKHRIRRLTEIFNWFEKHLK